MWKLVVGFIVFAALALFILSRGGDIDLSGEKHGTEATHAPDHAASSPAAPSAPAAMASEPVKPASAP